VTRGVFAAVEKALSGHLSIGPVTLYGANAMHWGVTISTRRWGYVCFRLPLPCFGKWWPLYFYASPNATPWASTYSVGGGHSKLASLERSLQAESRRRAFGHGFCVSQNAEELQRINQQARYS